MAGEWPLQKGVLKKLLPCEEKQAGLGDLVPLKRKDSHETHRAASKSKVPPNRDLSFSETQKMEQDDHSSRFSRISFEFF